MECSALTVHPTILGDPKTLVVVNSRRVGGDQEAWESRSYITSHCPHASLLAHTIHRLTLSLLRQEKTNQRGAKNKQF